jgi:hypothetical protein
MTSVSGRRASQHIHHLILMELIKSRNVAWAGHLARTGNNRNVLKILVAVSGKKKQLCGSANRWVNSIKALWD